MSNDHAPVAPAYESPAVHQHLTMQQGIITRMAVNSRWCKTWCVVLLTGVLLLAAITGEGRHAFLAAVPIGMLMLLDAYYLHLERVFRLEHEHFVKRTRLNGVDLSELVFDLRPIRSRQFSWVVTSVGSFAVWPFYVSLAGMVLWAGLWV